MKITNKTSQVRSIHKDDPKFLISDGFMLTPRAGFVLNPKMPREYRMIIQQCLNNGWLNPVAYMTEKEMMISGLLKK